MYLNYTAILPPCGNRSRVPPPGSALYYFGHFLPVIFITGVIGNILNLIVLTSGSMRSRTNVFLSCMAFADLCFLILMSWLNTTTFDGPANDDTFLGVYYRSKITITMLANWVAGCSTWFAVAVTCERYIAVRYPLKASYLLNKCSMSVAAFLIILITFLSYLHYFYWMHAVPRPLCTNPEETVYFFVTYSRHHSPTRFDYVRVSTAFSGVLCVVTPIILSAIFNSLLIYSLYRSQQTLASLGQSSRSNQERRITITVIIITATAVVLLTPSVGLAVWDTTDFGPNRRVPEWYGYFAYFCNFLVILDRALNFLLYCLSSQAFRRKLIAVLKGLVTKKETRNHHTGSTVISTTDIIRPKFATTRSPRSPQNPGKTQHVEMATLLVRRDKLAASSESIMTDR